ncbi:16S rRNA (uracil(1498)-N(3))-methyltransferase [Thioalkalicoccus limnaeus]|uniref:Ribosomal RNA small subunit methyltransferase E n=1 Tax=Thioalkalicoccus limnaeus TaxID=120681 RepID=A0ABV4BDH7_9GAMM
MRDHRIFVDEPLAPGQTLVLPPDATQHLIGVLRLTTGTAIRLFNGDGLDYAGRLLDTNRRGVRIAVEQADGLPEAHPSLTIRLGLGVSRGERFDYALQKAVELGVNEIQPLFTERSVVRLAGDRLAKRERHWRGILISACEQSGRRRLPLLAPTTRLGDWLARGQPGGLLLDPRAEGCLPDLAAPQGAVTLLVGTEGGLDDEERGTALRAGFTGVRLGPRILRTETAPLAAIAAIQVLWGDFRRC